MKFRLTKSPFLNKADRSNVIVTRGDSPYTNTRVALSRIDLSPARGKKVLLKPNAGRIAVSGSGINTDCQVIAAAIDSFCEAGAEVAVGESPIHGVSVMDAFDSVGITNVVQGRECEKLDINANPFVEVSVPDGLAVESLKICPEVFEYDIIVSLPVMKTHMHTGVTLSVKNMKGCLWRRSKVELHMLAPVKGLDEKSINVAIADMSGVLCAHLSIIDGTVGMEGLGPSAGRPKKMGLVVVSADPFAADAVACGLMGISANKIPHLRMGAERGYGKIDFKSISVTPDNWRDWCSPFLLPPENLSLEFPGVEILDVNSCSACQSTLLLLLKNHGDALLNDYNSSIPLSIAIGNGVSEIPDGCYCIGNCTAKHRGKGVFIPGCPPVGSQILSVIYGKCKVKKQE